MNDQEKQPTSNDVDRVGRFMILMAWIIAIAFATWFFAGVEEKQYNPNSSPASRKNQTSISVELVRNKYGHYVVNGKLDGNDVVFMLDTGATDIAIPGALAKTLNLTRGRAFQVHTANGSAMAYATDIDDIQIGEIVLRNVRASISPSMEGEEILLGMSALKRVDFRQTGNKLTLTQHF